MLGFFGILSAQAQQSTTSAIDKYFQQYLEDERFTVVYVSSKLMSMFGKLDIESMEMDDAETKAIMELASDLKGIRILVTEETPNQFYKEAKQKIDTREYEILMTVRNKDEENVEFLVKDNGEDLIEELLLMVGGGEQFVLMSFVGNIDMNKISTLINEFDDDKEGPAEQQNKQ